MMRRRGVLLTFLVAGMLAGVSLFAAAYDVIPVEKGGELIGTVKYSGDPQSNASHQVVNNADFCGASVEEEKYIVGPGHGLQNVVVSIEGIQSGKKSPNVLLLIENRKCHFVPHVQVGMLGDVYEVRNSDPVLHNTHLHMEEATLLNIAMPAGGRNIKKTIVSSGLINVKCDAHKFMQGWIVVAENPYNAVTDNEGHFKITDIPPGKYRVKFWHEGFQSKVKEVEVSPNKSSAVSVDFK
jgi:hypothetical protein